MKRAGTTGTKEYVLVVDGREVLLTSDEDAAFRAHDAIGGPKTTLFLVTSSGCTLEWGPGWTIIFRPNTPSAKNVVGTWDEVQAVLAATKRHVQVHIDDSVAPAVVPSNSTVINCSDRDVTLRSDLTEKMARLVIAEREGPAFHVGSGGSLHFANIEIISGGSGGFRRPSVKLGPSEPSNQTRRRLRVERKRKKHDADGRHRCRNARS